MMRSLLAACLLVPLPAWANGLLVSDSMVPMAPPGVMAHAAFLTLENTGMDPVSVVGVSSEGYRMAHIHRAEEVGGVATMTSIDVLEIAPGQTVTFAHGGLHVMLMHPKAPVGMGDSVPITFNLSDGTTLSFEAPVKHMAHGS